jgi:hypothetical protein
MNQLRKRNDFCEGYMNCRKIAHLLLVGVFLTTVVWGREDRLVNTGITPAAEGKVITSTDRNGNTQAEVQVKHLATPQKLTPPRQAYLVWVQPRGKSPELLGVLRVNDKLEGNLTATTPYKVFDIIVTAEDTPHPEMPSDTVVLKGTVERK